MKVSNMVDENSDLKNLIIEGLNSRQSQILEPFADEICAYYAERQAEVPEKLYHYTPYWKAKSICKNREFWMFSIFDPATPKNKGAGTPDQREVIAGLEIISDEIHSIFNGENTRWYRMFGDRMENVFNKRYSDFAQVHMFCVSASKSRDLWKSARGCDEKSTERQDPACLVFTDEMFVRLCAIEEERHDGKSTGSIEPYIVCYHGQELRNRVRPICISAKKNA